MMSRRFQLDDKYTLESGSVYMTGIQALVRLPLGQMRRDRRAGLRTGAFISGYEGSPLGGYDLALEQVRGLLAGHNIHFVPGVNEDLAATAVMGSQTYQALPNPKVDGVVGIWYGKGPGVDRTGDVFRHANLAGTGKHCGALALAGDDHMAKSSTIPHQSELSFFNYGMPTLAPGNTQEVLDYGLAGIALSRYCGAWAGMKLATDICDGGGTVDLSPERPSLRNPELSIGGQPYEKVMNPLLIVPNSLLLEQELHERRLLAAREFARVNGLNEVKVRHSRDRLGIVTAGKSYYDLMSALADLGLGAAELERAGIRVLKLAMVYPIEASIVEEFVDGLEELIVIEEKRSFIELQLRELLFNRPIRPKMLGKHDAEARVLFPAAGELNADMVAQALARRLQPVPVIERRLELLAEIEARFTETKAAPPRAPSYCSGCPHNRSTYLLEGQIAGGGIGCHGMAAGLDHAQRGIAYIAQMGGEGAAWIGTAPFSGTEHIFQNLGDGTYFHSGRMAVNAAVAAGVNLTYKILFNGGVAMTGGQAVAGGLPIPALTRELEAAGVKPIVLLTDDLSRYDDRSSLAASVEVRPREDLEETLAALEKTPGVSAMIYDQMCAAEKRRRRNRGKMAQPVRRILINERVCEGCGDCVVKSNCVSLHPVETEFGPKTRIHQSSCNADYTCALGDCPSFVSVMVAEGTGLKRKPLPELPEVTVEEPAEKVALDGEYRILMPGVGGTGVVTVNALLATAAMLDGRYVSTLDQTGMAQKGGAVVSHLTVSPRPISASHRINHGGADLLLGFDLVGSAGKTNLKRADPRRTAAVINSHNIPTGDSIRKGLTVLSTDGHFLHLIREFTRADRSVIVDASGLAESLFGGHLQTNIFLLGVAYQAGVIPITSESLEETIRLNGVAVERNLQAFRWGRRYQQDPASVLAVAGVKAETRERLSLPGLIESRVKELTAYQNRAYAGTFRQVVEEVQRAEQQARPGSTELTEAVARHLYKLMAYKDEYEVARLLTDPASVERVRETFEAPGKTIFHLHPPLLRSMGLKRKLALGPWFRPVLRLLAAMKFLRGTPLDLFGWAGVRREERALIAWYQDTLRLLLPGLNAANLAIAAEIARLPDQIRGYEHIKLRSAESVRRQAEEKLTALLRESAA